VVERECQEQAQRIFQIENQVEAVEPVLRHIARSYVEFLVSPFAQNMFRVAIAEAQRFPDPGLAFYSSGSEIGTDRLKQFLAAAVDRGELAIEDVDLAAHQFVELCKADIFYKRLLCVKSHATEAEIDRIANGAVTTFLKAFSS